MEIRECLRAGGICFVPLSRGLVATVDVADYALVAGRNWCALSGNSTFYAVSHEPGENGRGTLYMHRHILGLPGGSIDHVDHVDRDGLNNRRDFRESQSTRNVRP